MSSIKLTVGEAIIKFLDNQYVSLDGKETKFVERVYTLFGHGCVLGAGEALAMSSHGLKVMQGKNEQGMAHAATAYAKQHNRTKIIPCFSSIGPGAANMVTAAATATVNNIPLLLFPGDTFASRQPDPVLQQLEQHYDPNITTNDAYKAVVKYFDRITRPEHVLTALTNAVRVLLSPADTGAVCIALPQDVQGECFDYPAEFFEKRVTRIPRAVAPEEDMLDAADLIASSKKPILICGGGVRYSLAAQTLLEFAQKFNIPIAETQAGKGVIPSSHPLNLGGIGVTGNSAANAVAKDADLVIAVSSRLSDFTTASKSLYPKAKAVTINIRPFDAQKFSAAKVVGDAKLSLIKLAELLSKKNYKSGYTSEIKNAKADWEAEYDRLSKIEYGKNFDAEVSDKSPDAVDAFIAAYGGGVCQTSALALINKTVPKDAIVVGASGSLPGCLQRMWKTDAFGGYNMEYGYSCMGYEIAGALGAKLAEPDREVYAMAGDGSFLMLHSEMHTALQEGAKINILLFDNGGFGCINNLQMSMGIESLCTEFRYHDGADASSFIPVDYAKIAEGYGYKSYSAKTLDELETALKAALKETRPTLIDIKTLPKTMTHGYGGWWNTGLTMLPRNDKQRAALSEKQEKLKNARKY